MAEIILKPADIFLTKGPGLFSRMIRFFSRSIGESRTRMNHAGLVVEEGQAGNAVPRSREVAFLWNISGYIFYVSEDTPPLSLTSSRIRPIVVLHRPNTGFACFSFIYEVVSLPRTDDASCRKGGVDHEKVWIAVWSGQ
jgi:hypothetical protein